MKNKSLDIEWVRQQFPALKNKMAFMDNAGGSQTLKPVIDRITEYLTEYDVQLGASYHTSQLASEKLDLAKITIKNWINAKHPEEVMIGSSTTMLLRILSLCISQNWQENDEVIITNCDHEANMAPWRDLQKLGIKINTWKLNKDSYRLELNDLEDLMTENTKLVAVTHTSNILGTINPVKDIAKLVHSHNALICVDGVAFAPHRLIDVQDLDVDFYVFSTYKTFGPHQAVFYGKLALLTNMNGINHAFIESVPYKFQPGNLNYELSYSLAAIPDYIRKIGDNNLTEGFEMIAIYEQELANQLLDYLNSNHKIKIIGEISADKDLRVATISFIHSDLKSNRIVEQVDAFNIGIRFGDFYAVELIDDLGLRQYNGVVRVSLVHYNNSHEVDKLIGVFKSILS
ncbi:MAG: cysteine desulfurase-like protein [Alcanivoracaceae bacterium]|nr:cysteine desulfurase-like protein [Alcanivoracaceae bacterium]